MPQPIIIVRITDTQCFSWSWDSILKTFMPFLDYVLLGAILNQTGVSSILPIIESQNLFSILLSHKLFKNRAALINHCFFKGWPIYVCVLNELQFFLENLKINVLFCIYG